VFLPVAFARPPLFSLFLALSYQVCSNRRVVDIHCHILPEVDDGPKNWQTAQAMCSMAAEDGIEHMVAAPHANNRYHYDRAYLAQLLVTLQQKIGPAPRLTLGCDFHLSSANMRSALEAPERFCIGNTHYLLVEFSNAGIPQQIDGWFMQMKMRGLTPVITHPERNPLLQQNTNQLLQWISLGCAVQVTASSVTGGWGDRAQQSAHWLIRQHAVHFLASDAHDLERRPPLLSAVRELVAREFSEELATSLFDTNPGAVVKDQPLPFFEKPSALPRG